MKAIRISRHGGPEVLETVDVPEPGAGPGQVRVRVTHVGLNHLDVWVRKGVPGHKFPLPLIPGSDVVGVREDTGERVALYPATSCKRCRRCLEGHHDLCRQFRIRGEGMDGGCREALVVPEDELLPCPLPPEVGAATPLALLTAWHALVGRAAVRPGDRVLVQGGAGGVGTFAIQVARLCGARVAATASTPEKRGLCEKLGAEVTWDYDGAVAGMKSWSREGADVVIDSNGVTSWAQTVRMVRWGGTIVTYGATAGASVELDLRVVFFKQLSLLGSTMGGMGEMHAAWDAVLSGRIVTVVDRVLPMSRLGEAHAALEERRVAGKVVVEQDLA
jgi:NADPH:quinone reductase-like Zn-dependent oxidoreductase